MMITGRFKAQDLIAFGAAALSHPRIGFTEKQARAAATILVEADLRGDPDHGIAGGNTINEIYAKIHEDAALFGFQRFRSPAYPGDRNKSDDYIRDPQKYPTLQTVDANGLLGHYVALDIIPDLVRAATRYGYAKAYIRNSTHFGNCGIYSEMIAEKDLAARVSCTTAAWTKPFIELQGTPEHNRRRYAGVKKRFGTNPIAWSIPYDTGIVTIDMATTQRAVSPALDVAGDNAAALGIRKNTDGVFIIGKENRQMPLRDVHLRLAGIDDADTLREELGQLGYRTPIPLKAVEKGLLKGPSGEDILYPLAFDDVFKQSFWVAPLGGTLFGYKGFGLNMLVELDNVTGGGEPELIRRLDPQGKPETLERVSQTLEAYAIDMLYPLAEAKERLGQAVRTTRRCGNPLMFLPGEKEQLRRREYVTEGIPMTLDQLTKLKTIAEKIGVPFNLKPVTRPPVLGEDKNFRKKCLR